MDLNKTDGIGRSGADSKPIVAEKKADSLAQTAPAVVMQAVQAEIPDEVAEDVEVPEA